MQQKKDAYLKEIRLVEYSKVSSTFIINYFPLKISEQNNTICIKKDTISFTNTILKDIRLVEYSKVSWTSIINYFPIKMSEQNNIKCNKKDTTPFINT